MAQNSTIELYEITVAQFERQLLALKGILQKAQGFAETKKIDVGVLLQTRLAPDQFPLSKQIQIACDSAKFGVSRLTGKEAPKFEDNETTLSEFLQRIDKTVAFIKTVRPGDFSDYTSKVVRFPWNPGYRLSGADYLVSHALPNFQFHVTTAYSILRASGVTIGKADFLGQQNWVKEDSP